MDQNDSVARADRHVPCNAKLVISDRQMYAEYGLEFF